jgi:biotin carboxylase
VIELNGRIGGGVPEMLLDATGVEFLPIALRLALGESVTFDAPPAARQVAYLLYVQSPAWMRKVTSVDGLKELAADPAVTEVILNRGPGQSVHWRDGNHGHVFSVRGVVADHDALRAFEQRVHDEVTIAGEGETESDEGVGSQAFESR